MSSATAEPVPTQSSRLREERVQELCAASIRALTGEPRLHFRGGWLHHERSLLPLYAPHLHPPPDADFACFRGAADGMALRFVHSDPGIHRALRPSHPVERLVFEMLEQFRVESLARSDLPGVVENLRHRHRSWSLDFYHSGLTETSRGILIYTVAQICRSRVTREPVVEETEDLLETTRGSITPRLGHDLAGLRRCRENQSTYAEHALAIARVVGSMLLVADDEEGNTDDADDEAHPGRLPLFLEPAPDSAESASEASTGASGAEKDANGGYLVFTTAYDREVPASSLVRPAQLAEYRVRLDERMAQEKINIQRLARELRLLLAQPSLDGWDTGQQEGLIDGRRLTELISSPTEHRIFKVPRTEPLTDCLVTFLIDCSGSMKQYSESIAVLVDGFARALDLLDAVCEVLGYTTGAWNGGRAVRDWRARGRPGRPGRLNERCHIVFKDARTSWRRGRSGMAALLKQDLFREGIDGEAVDWACQRMEEHERAERILIVISDGAPMDGATLLHNDADYLDRHLSGVVRHQEEKGSVRVHGLGLGLDLSRYYSRSHAIDLSNGVDNRILREVVALLAGRGVGHR